MLLLEFLLSSEEDLEYFTKRTTVWLFSEIDKHFGIFQIFWKREIHGKVTSGLNISDSNP